jgi:HAD superfamily hydrolase (TIGR01490 family)
MKPVAFFDVDGTIFRSSLLIEIVEQLIKEEVFPVDVKDMYSESYRSWKNREGSYDDYIRDVIEAFVTQIQGVHYGVLVDIGRQVVAIQSKRVYCYTRDLIQELKKQGYVLIAISQSPKTILDDFCSQYGFDKVYGRIYEIGPQDRFTGVTSEEHLIKNKANIVKRVFERHPELSRVNSIAVGDTEGDISLLECVSRPICFNPNQALYTHAKRNGWEVVVERKDVIYKL